MNYLLGLLGHRLEHSLSPAMHRAALAYFGLTGDYRLLDIEAAQLPQQLPEIVQQGFQGLNVTCPHKQSLLPLCSELTFEARQAQAVNTLKPGLSGKWQGHNTDWDGFLQTLNELPVKVKGAVACVIGSGGAARAVAWALAYQGWPKIEIISRNEQAAARMVQELQVVEYPDKSQRPQILLLSADLRQLTFMPDLLVNATPAGMKGQEPPDWILDLLKCMDPQGVFFDLVYSPNGQPTALVSEARRLRLFCLDGTAMLVRQAASSFAYWTGKTPPLELMSQALQEARRQRQE